MTRSSALEVVSVLFVLILTFVPIAAGAAACVPTSSGTNSQTFTTPGTCDFTVPNFVTLTAQVWGGGGSGASGNSAGPRAGNAGGNSSFAGAVFGYGGGAGQQNAGSAGGSYSGDSGVAGGAGGAPNQYSVISGSGGAGGNGGAGGSGAGAGGSTLNGSAPGGGGGGGAGYTVQMTPGGPIQWWYALGGGGGGGYGTKTFTPATLAPNSTVTIVVGSGASPTIGAQIPGGSGGNGQVIITWTQQSCTTPPDSVASGNGFSLFAGILNRWLNSFGYSYCISNSGGNNYFIPARTSGELQSFLNAIPRLTGVTTATP